MRYRSLSPTIWALGFASLSMDVSSELIHSVLPLFMVQAEPRLKALSPPLEDCESTLWLLAHPESRHLRRIATVYQHLADGIRLPAG